MLVVSPLSNSRNALVISCLSEHVSPHFTGIQPYEFCLKEIGDQRPPRFLKSRRPTVTWLLHRRSLRMPDTLEDKDWEDEDWKDILLPIKYGKCTPFLGAGACFGVLPLGSDIAQEWAKEHDFPLEDSTNLAQVAQFIAVKRNPLRPKYEIKERFEKVTPPDFTKFDEPHGLLAELPFPVYITTNYDDFMVQALKSLNKDPKQELCRWNKVVKGHPSVFEQESVFEPTNQCPVVFHLHGHIGVPASLVLTEDDYLDFLVNISKDQGLIPSRIQRAFRETSLLFLGYQLADWDFRVLFRSLAGYLEKGVSQAHVSVQLVPVGDKASDKQRAKVRDYLDRYFAQLSVRVYWGTCRKFANELRERWRAFNCGK